MKKVILTLLVGSLIFLLNACGGEKIEGEWKIDPSSFDIVLGEGFPDEMKAAVEQVKVESKKAETKEEFDKAIIEFKPDGTAILKDADNPEESEEIHWEKKGDKIRFKGEIEGEPFDFQLDILNYSKDKMELGITGEDLLEQIRTKHPELLEGVPGFIDLEKLVKGGKISIDLVRA